MKQRLLLTLFASLFILTIQAQKKQQKLTAFAITGVQKGHSNWTEVRLVDVITGEEVKPVYQSSQQVDVLNARTGKKITLKDVAQSTHELTPSKREVRVDVNAPTAATTTKREYVIIDNKVVERTPSTVVTTDGKRTLVRKITTLRTTNTINHDQPFATNSAAIAYDKKHERLYYTPMGINQLRYIDLKTRSTKIFYFENEAFGALSNPRDIPNQITRMVIGADGNGYALTNNGNHLIKFTTNKKAVITDLGALTDDPSNGANSVHGQNVYGGDMIADADGSLYLISANRHVFKIDLKSKVAKFKGSITGLPKNYSTNGAIVEEGSKVIVSSSTSTTAYFRFDLNTLVAEKISTGAVYNASDMANGNLANTKDKKEDQKPDVKKEEYLVSKSETPVEEVMEPNNISVFPNPVTNGFVKLSFKDHLPGKYQLHLMDISGKMLNAQTVNVSSRMHVEEYKLPALLSSGNYVIKVLNDDNKVISTNKIIVK